MAAGGGGGTCNATLVLFGDGDEDACERQTNERRKEQTRREESN